MCAEVLNTSTDTSRTRRDPGLAIPPCAEPGGRRPPWAVVSLAGRRAFFSWACAGRAQGARRACTDGTKPGLWRHRLQRATQRMAARLLSIHWARLRPAAAPQLPSRRQTCQRPLRGSGESTPQRRQTRLRLRWLRQRWLLEQAHIEVSEFCLGGQAQTKGAPTSVKSWHQKGCQQRLLRFFCKILI